MHGSRYNRFEITAKQRNYNYIHATLKMKNKHTASKISSKFDGLMSIVNVRTYNKIMILSYRTTAKRWICLTLKIDVKDIDDFSEYWQEDFLCQRSRVCKNVTSRTSRLFPSISCRKDENTDERLDSHIVLRSSTNTNGRECRTRRWRQAIATLKTFCYQWSTTGHLRLSTLLSGSSVVTVCGLQECRIGWTFDVFPELCMNQSFK